MKKNKFQEKYELIQSAVRLAHFFIEPQPVLRGEVAQKIDEAFESINLSLS